MKLKSFSITFKNSSQCLSLGLRLCLRLCLCLCLCLSLTYNLNAQDIGTGVAWGTLSPGEPLLLNEKFQGFAHFHSRANTNDSNSRNTADGEGNITAWGLKNDSVAVPIIGSSTGKIIYKFYQCAFSPIWLTAYAFRDSLAGTGTPENTPNVSRGFVEISRLYPSHYTVDGHFQVDLRQIEFVEVIQYSHSSTGGQRRGLTLLFSLDNGTSWDTVRYQPGDGWSRSYTRDLTTLEKTANTFNCTPSAYGMTWEDGIYASNVMLKFTIANNQALRIHDLKIYGTYSGGTRANAIKENGLKIFAINKKIRISEEADVWVYNIAGQLVKSVDRTNLVSTEELPDGMYLVRANAGSKVKTVKVLIK